MHPDDQSALAQTLQVNLVQNPSKYLGMDFKLRGNRCADFQFLVDKLQSRLQGWKIRLLSQAGRSTLISSVLQALPLYTLLASRIFLQNFSSWKAVHTNRINNSAAHVLAREAKNVDNCLVWVEDSPPCIEN